MSNGGDPNATQKYMKRNLLHVILTHAFVPERNEKLELLLTYRADLDSLSAMEETPMMAATVRGNPEATLMLLNAGADPDVYKPRSPQKLIHFVARENQTNRGQDWKNETKDYFDAIFQRLEQNGDSLEGAERDILRWQEIGRSYPVKEIRRLMDEEMARINAKKPNL
ncbi:MAG TPA: ankyrin repeat domain-containing protein [Fuerstia sp.]|nr:ankyrin repeat domain-containing protein [Fuerstiella sp.]